jgi:hypothetical protein
MNLPWTQQIATFSSSLPVILTIQQERAEFNHVVAQLVATLKERFILLAPTSRHMDAHAHALLNGAKAGFFDLESNLTLMSNGTLHARRSGGELFSGLLPANESSVKTAGIQHAFLVLQRLKSKRANMKAPPYDVFMLIVVDRVSQREAAVKCGCSLGLIATRVQELERLFNLRIRELQAMGSTLVDMQTTVKGKGKRNKKPGSPDARFADDDRGYEGEPEEEEQAPKEEYAYDSGADDD